MPSKTRIYRLYGLADGKGQVLIKVGQWAWPLYQWYSSKAAAENGVKQLRFRWPSMGKRGGTGLMVAKTALGWGVFQLSAQDRYRIKGSDRRLEPLPPWYKLQ